MITDCPSALNPGLTKRAERLAHSHGKTQVVLSFGARAGGAYFAKWLRYTIMQHMNWHQVNSVYLDTECLKEAEGTKLDVKDAARPWLIGVASMNEGWKEYYRFAVEQATLMIFVATPEWTNSPYCAMEKRYYIHENYHRRRNRLPPLHGVELSIAGHQINVPGARVIPAEKVDVETHYEQRHAVRHRANHGAAARFGVTLKNTKLPTNQNWQGNYTIAGVPLLKLLAEIRSH